MASPSFCPFLSPVLTCKEKNILEIQTWWYYSPTCWWMASLALGLSSWCVTMLSNSFLTWPLPYWPQVISHYLHWVIPKGLQFTQPSLTLGCVHGPLLCLFFSICIIPTLSFLFPFRDWSCQRTFSNPHYSAGFFFFVIPLYGKLKTGLLITQYLLACLLIRLWDKQP